MKVIHILYQSLPQVSGSSIRSRDILISQKEIGMDVLAVTSPFQRSLNEGNKDIIDGIAYHRTGNKASSDDFGKQRSLLTKIARFFSIIPFGLKLYKLVKKEKPDLLHAHAMFYCALPALIVGRLLGIPVIYEFRSLWMYDINNANQNSLSAKFWFNLETFLLKKSDYVIFLNENLKTYFEDEGLQFPDSSVISNAVNTTYINHLKAQAATTHKTEGLVFGYIGTITAYEGLDFLIKVSQELYDEGLPFKLIIYGKGDDENKIFNIINDRRDIKSIEYRGAVSPDNVFVAYSELDVIINPRLKTKITDSVTPLKPLEAMAYEKLFIGSDVGGILEITKPDETGIIFTAGDKQSLKNSVKRVADMPKEQFEEIKKSALNYVQSEKSWIQNAYKYKGIYNLLLEQFKRSISS